MWKISYTWSGSRSFAYFDSYDEAKKVYDALFEKYKDAGNVYLNKVVTKTFNEVKDRNGLTITEYEIKP